MKTILKKLQNKPERVREQIALFAAGGVTIVVIAIWGLSLGNSFRKPAPVLTDGAVDESVQPEKPFSLFYNSLSSGLKEQRKSLKENNPFDGHDETTPYETPVVETSTEMTVVEEEQSPATQETQEQTPQDTTLIDASKDQTITETVVQ